MSFSQTREHKAARGGGFCYIETGANSAAIACRQPAFRPFSTTYRQSVQLIDPMGVGCVKHINWRWMIGQARFWAAYAAYVKALEVVIKLCVGMTLQHDNFLPLACTDPLSSRYKYNFSSSSLRGGRGEAIRPTWQSWLKCDKAIRPSCPGWSLLLGTYAYKTSMFR